MIQIVWTSRQTLQFVCIRRRDSSTMFQLMRYIVLPVALVIALGSATGSASSIVGKTKRDLSIVGPVPSGYRGQATGQTTFDGIAADDLTLPVASGNVQTDAWLSESRDGLRANRAPEAQQFRTFQQTGQTFAANGNRQFSGLDDFGRANSGPDRPLETTVDGIVSEDLSLPLPPIGFQGNAFHGKSREPTVGAGNVDLFDPETPTQRHDRLTNQYADVLTEYRSSLSKFNDELNDYSEVKAKLQRPRQ